MSKFKSREFIIGICVIVALVILFFGIDYLKGINLFKPANFYVVEYENVAGLEVAAPVHINGYKVGQVREIDFPYDREGKIKVILALDKKLLLPEGTEATIEQSLLSGAFVSIQMGQSKKMIPVGGTLTARTGGDLMATLSEELLPKVGSSLSRLDSVLYNLNVLSSDPALLNSIQRLDGITTDVSYSVAGLRNTMTYQLPGIMTTAGRAANNIDSITCDLALLSKELRQLPLQSTMENVEATTAHLEQFSRQLNSQTSTLGRLNNDPELYNRLNQVSADIDSLIVDIKRNPNRYISNKLLYARRPPN